jgi:hypothetical protein
MWSAELQQRISLERALLKQYALDQFDIYWDQAESRYYGYGVATTSAGRKYALYLLIPSNFPYARPSLYITDPRPLLTHNGQSLASLGTSHAMHTLSPTNNCVQICHWRDERWHSGILLHKVFLKGLMWLEAFEQHLATGEPLSQFVSTMVGAL